MEKLNPVRRQFPCNKSAQENEKQNIFFFCQGFLSRTLTTHRTAGEGREPSYSTLPLPPADGHIQTFICNFAREMTITYF